MGVEKFEDSARRSPWLMSGGHVEDDNVIMLHGVWFGEWNVAFESALDGTWIALFNEIRQPLRGLLDEPANDISGNINPAGSLLAAGPVAYRIPQECARLSATGLHEASGSTPRFPSKAIRPVRYFMSEIETIRAHVALADRNVAQAESNVERQAAIIAGLENLGKDTSDAERLLEGLRKTLRAFRVQREEAATRLP